MKTFLTLLLALWLPLSAFAATSSGNIANVFGLGYFGPASTAVGGPSAFLQIPSTKTVFSIHAGDAQTAATNGNFYPFYKNGVAFQAGASGTYCFNFTLIGATTNTGVELVSATASFAFNAASLTGGVFQMGASGKTGLFTTNAQVRTAQPGVYTFGANTFGGFQAENSQTFQVSADCYDL